MAKITIIANKRHEQLLSSVKENVINKYPHVKVNSKEGYEVELEFTKQKKQIISMIALTITSYVIISIDDSIIRDAIDFDSFDLPEEEISYIIASIKSSILNDGDLYAQILFMLDADSVFNLSGFLKFRNQDRAPFVREISYRALDDFFTEQELSGFIQVVQRFLYIQLPKSEFAHIIETESGEIRVLDDTGEEIDLAGMKKELEENLPDIDNGFEIQSFDLIMSAILALLPKTIHLHFPHYVDMDMKYLLEKAFEGKFVDCTGCEICQQDKKEEDE